MPRVPHSPTEGDTNALSCPVCQPAGDPAGPYRGSAPTQRRHVPLAPLDYEAGIIVQACHRCDGLWLEEGQLRQIQDARVNQYGDVTATDVVMRHRHAPADEPPPPCPRCEAPMWPSTFKTSAVPYVSCLTCGGTWVQRAALRDIEAFWEKLIR